ncbi:MAG: hypothetical protein VKK32_07285 [Candidatus Melainabacteria bacterium]|nr:hypothetical protein [Candidatus Melainabacteria bacterium]
MVVNNKRYQQGDGAEIENKPLSDIELIECNFANRFIERFAPLVISIFNGYINDGEKRPISELPLANKLALAANFPKYTSEKIIHENIKTSRSYQFNIKSIKEWVFLMTNYISPKVAIGITNPKEFEKLMNDFFIFFDQESNKDIYAGSKPRTKITALRKSVINFFQAVQGFLCLHWQDTKCGPNLDIEKYHELKNIKIPLKEKLNLDIELNSGDEKLKEALSQYLGKVGGKSKTGPYFKNDPFSYNGRTWQCEEIKKAFKILGKDKNEATRVKLAAYADQYKKTFKNYALEEFPSNQANSIESLSNQASKISKDTIVKLLQDYLIKNKRQNQL